jgi:hypothetical protein
MLTADKALDDDANTFAHTEMGRGHWWMAAFTNGKASVSEVRITNRADCCGDRLAGTEVWVGDRKCGVVPNGTTNGTVYTVQCMGTDGVTPTALTGKSVIIKQDTTYTALQLAKVQVFGDSGCNHDERLNASGAHKCSHAGECAGNRTCSRWGWCGGESGCPAATPQTIRDTYVAAEFKENYICGELDVEEYDKEKTMTSWEQCSKEMFGAGFEYFIFNEGNNDMYKCRGCNAGSQVDGQANAYPGVNIYSIKPNYPLNLQDPADNKQCTKTCDPNTPFDDALNSGAGACMSTENLKSITCGVSEFGYINKLSFAHRDGSTVEQSHSESVTGLTDVVIEINAGERVTKVIN